MITEQRAVNALRLFLVLLFAILVVFQVHTLPSQLASVAEGDPDLAHLRWPMTVVAVFWVLCIQVVVVATWRLLSLVQDDRIFSDVSFGWVNAILGAVGAAWLVLLGVFVYFVATWDDHGLPLLLLLLLVGVAVLGLLMLVMRALLRQATTLRTDMEAVI